MKTTQWELFNKRNWTRFGVVAALAGGMALAVSACGDDDDSPSAPDVTVCLEECVEAADCFTTSSVDENWSCTSSRCDYSMCDVDADCTVILSGWNTACTDGGGECSNQVCIDIGDGVGRCATEPDVLTCAQMNMADLDMPPIDGSADVTVCANTTNTCSSNLCVGPVDLCTDDADCTTSFDKCNTDTGACYECDEDVDCAGGNSTTCVDGYCGCTDDTECTATTADVCYDGLCGCSSVDVCTGTLSGASTTWACEEL